MGMLSAVFVAIARGAEPDAVVAGDPPGDAAVARLADRVSLGELRRAAVHRRAHATRSAALARLLQPHARAAWCRR